MEKTINIDGHDYNFKATAATPYVYRHAFGRDIFTDCGAILAAIGTDSTLDISVLDAFECVAFCFNSQAEGRKLNRDTIEQDMTDWLDQFETLSIRRIFPQLLDLWRLNNEQTSTPKNQAARPNDK